MIRIAATQYTLKNKAFEIYVAGCKANPHCDGCHNPELWSFKNGTLYNEEYKNKIFMKIKSFDDMIDKIWLVGGEPLDQKSNELSNLIDDLKESNKEIWLFTRYKLKEVPKDILSKCDYVKCGRYLKTKIDNHEEYGVLLVSKNQHIYKKGKDYE